MDVATITMPREEAQSKLEAYQKALRRRADEEYEQIAAGYEAMAEGTPLINLTEVISGGGFDEKGRPRLAVARADRRQVEFSWHWNQPVGVFDTRRSRRSSDSLVTSIEFRKMPPIPQGLTYRPRGFALVPLVPADLEIPVADLPYRYILWEVEHWSERSLFATPDRDPYLLEFLGGDLYAIRAAWDLTELERSVMSGRATS